MLPLNKFTLFALAWFVSGVYSLVFMESSGTTPPPFPHFDKLAHCGLFFAHFWLLAKAYIHEQRPIPYFALMILALIYAIGSEWAQATFTLTRQGSVTDGVADLVGAGLALTLAHRLTLSRQHTTSSN